MKDANTASVRLKNFIGLISAGTASLGFLNLREFKLDWCRTPKNKH